LNFIDLNNYQVLEGSFSSHQDELPLYFKQLTPLKPQQGLFHLITLHGASAYHKVHEVFHQAILNKYSGRVILSFMDLVGHGLSGGRRNSVDSFDIYQEDFLKFIQLVWHQTDHKNAPLFIMGESLGGMIVLSSLINSINQIPFKVNGAILSSPCIKPKLEPHLIQKWAQHIPALFKRIRLPSIYSWSMIVSDPQKVIECENDPLIFNFMALDMAMAILNQSKKLVAQSYFLNIPSLFLISGNDVIVNSEITELFCKGTNKQITNVFKFDQEKHDLLGSLSRHEVYEKIFQFIEEYQ
jgi:alpha-beta hydrolase superfamily lysophospholipase